jgi:formate dehydrogenase accessory protein FdhE
MTPNYDARIRRAEYLSTTYPFAAEILAFYRRICMIQQKLSKELNDVLGRQSRLPAAAGTLREQMDLELVLPFVKQALSDVVPASPEPLALYIKEFLRGSPERWAASLERYVTKADANGIPEDSREELLARILIDPYAELLAARQGVLPSTAGNLCPLCEGRPVAGVLRSEGDGGKRFLLCAFCGTEWEFRRIYCAFCGESREQSLPVFVAEKFPHIRVEACDTCRHCIRSVDLTKDGHAIPVVDDLAAIPLALWADEYGYQRIQGNLLGT